MLYFRETHSFNVTTHVSLPSSALRGCFDSSNLKHVSHLADHFKKYEITRLLRGYLRSYYMLFSSEPPYATSHTPALPRHISALHLLESAMDKDTKSWIKTPIMVRHSVLSCNTIRPYIITRFKHVPIFVFISILAVTSKRKATRNKKNNRIL